MAGSRAKKRDSLPESFGSIQEFWEFWDTHSSADYEDLMEDVDVEFRLPGSRSYCPVAKNLIAQIRAEARRQGVSAETLVNLWLREKMADVSRS